MIEKMNEFFEARVNGYDDHMINDVEGCKEGYKKMASFIPKGTKKILDLGCGTGLELDEIFKIYPDIEVTGVDLTKGMLDKLKEKHLDKKITLINESYFDYDFGQNIYDVVISFQTMHHLAKKDKVELYKKIYNSLKENGRYIECDYMVLNQEEEDFYFEENKRIRKEQGIGEKEFYHYDTPCTVENEIKMFNEAGFRISKNLWRLENTTIIENIK